VEKTKIETYVTALLRDALRARAAEEGRPEAELVEEALASYLSSLPLPGESARPGFFEGIDRYQKFLGTPPLSEEEAMELADRAVHEYREAHPEIYRKHVRTAS
jgi:hypothetical protein